MYGSKQGRSLSTYPIHAVQKTTTALKNALWVSMHLAQKCLLGTLLFMSATGDGTAILPGHPSHAKVYPLAGSRKYSYFSVILRPWELVWPRESNLQLPALLSNALPTEINLPLNSGLQIRCKKTDLPPGSLLSFNRELKCATTTVTASTSHHAKFVKCWRLFRELSSKGLYLS